MNFADVIALLRSQSKGPDAPRYIINEIGTLCPDGSVSSMQSLDLQFGAAYRAGALVGIEPRNPQSLPSLSHYLATTGGGDVCSAIEWLRVNGDLPSTGAITLADVAAALEKVRASAVEQSPKYESGDEAHDRALLSSADLAEKFKLPHDSVRKALEGWRKRVGAGDGFVENVEARPNEPRFVYKVEAVRPTLETLQAKQNRRNARRKKTSVQLPAK